MRGEYGGWWQNRYKTFKNKHKEINCLKWDNNNIKTFISSRFMNLRISIAAKSSFLLKLMKSSEKKSF
jgi:DNA polymerase III delta subunit